MGKIYSYPFAVTIADESTAITSDSVPITGTLRGISCTAGAMDASDTYTFAIKDKHGITVFSRATLAESSTTNIWADANGATELTPLARPMVGNVTITITASAEQNDAAVDYSGYIYYEK